MKIARMLLVILGNIGVLSALAVPAYADHYSFDGLGGFKRSFSLTGGDYEVFLVAKIPAGIKYCFFSGMLERTSPAYEKISLGSAAEVSDNIFPWKIDRVMSLPAGQYTFWIASQTDCWWTFTMVLKPGQDSGRAVNAGQPGQDSGREANAKELAQILGQLIKAATNGRETCCVKEVVMLRIVPWGQYPSSAVSLKDHVRFYSSYIDLSPGKPFGHWILKHDGQIVNAGGLQTGLSPDKKDTIFYADVHWDQSDSKYLGEFTVEFVTTRGHIASEFTLTQ